MTDRLSGQPDGEALDKLKKILLTEDEEAIENLRDEIALIKAKIDDNESLVETIQPVIADALDRRIHDSKEEMAEALSPVMSDAIRIQVEEAKEDVADALYPVIGRMISKAVAEAMKKIVENINESVNRTLNLSLWIKRIKAKVLGVSTAEVLLAEQSPVGIHNLFFIEKRSGLLIAHISKDKDSQSVDAQVIGSMLTAIKQFAQDAFEQEADEQLKQIAYSDQTIRIDNGKYSYLAVVYSGSPDAEFDEELQKLHHRIHNRYYRSLRNYQGDNSEFAGIEKRLNRFIKRYGLPERTAF